MTTLGLDRLPGRCSGCGFHVATQGCHCDATTARNAALDAVNAATSPEVKARIDAAILTVARRGGEFSANDVRPLIPDLRGGVIGGRFGALSRRGVIEKVGAEPSSKGNTHGHDIKRWRLVGAA